MKRLGALFEETAEWRLKPPPDAEILSSAYDIVLPFVAGSALGGNPKPGAGLPPSAALAETKETISLVGAEAADASLSLVTREVPGPAMNTAPTVVPEPAPTVVPEPAPVSATTDVDWTGPKAQEHLRRHPQHARDTARRIGLPRPGSLDQVKQFLESVVQQGEQRIGQWGDLGQVRFSRLGDAIVIRRMDGKYVSN